MTHDDILNGRLKLWQPKEGPRVSMDTVLLSAWVRPPSPRKARFVELGAATGGVSLMLALRFPEPFHIVGLEIQESLVSLARRNARENDLEDRVTFFCGDLRSPGLLLGESFDGLVVNPPYESPRRGRLSPALSRSVARQEVCCSVSDVAEAAGRLLKGRGRLYSIFRADRLPELLEAFSRCSLVPKRLRFIHPKPGAKAKLFLLDCVKGGGEGLSVEPPLYVYDSEGCYTRELLQAYEPSGLE